MINTLALIEDDEVCAFVTQKIIENSHLVKQIKVFTNGKEAIDFFKLHAADAELLPEIIFLDLNMPIMDGWEFIEEYLKLKPKLAKKMALYIVSSSIAAEDVNRIKRIQEISDYIIKPVTKEKFAELIKVLEKDGLK